VNPLNAPPPFVPPPAPPPLRLPLKRPRVVYGLMVIIGLVFALEELSGGSQVSRVLINLGANYAPRVEAGEYWRLLTANFLHIGFFHVALNGYALYVLGQETEAIYGPARFLVIFLLAALAGAIASFAFTHGLSAGASTGIFGLIGTMIAYFIRNRKVFGAMGRSRLNNLLFVAAINIVYGVSVPGIDNWGHAGGFTGGLLLGWLLCPFYQIETADDGSRRVVDRNSLQAEWMGVGLVAVLLVVALVAALSFPRA
jgi:rhomboid protease GluP